MARSVIYLIAVTALSLSFSLSAQQHTKMLYNLDTPFTGEFTAERFRGDSIVIEEFDGAGNSEGKSTIVYTHSEDGLRDTMYTHSGVMRTQVYIYSKEGKLNSIVNLVPDRSRIDQLKFCAEGPQMNYEYEVDGRIRSISTFQNPGEKLVGKKIFDYNNHRVVSYDAKSKKNTTNKILYTDSGYLEISPSHWTFADYDTTIYVFDNEDRLIRKTSPSLEMTTGRINVTQHYIYTDSGYISITDSVKEMYIFAKDRSKEEILVYLNTKGKWQLHHREERLICAANHSSSTTPIFPGNTKVFSDRKGVVIETPQVAKIEIWSLTGQLIARQQASTGISHIPLSGGLYIISINGKGYKIAVQ